MKIKVKPAGSSHCGKTVKTAKITTFWHVETSVTVSHLDTFRHFSSLFVFFVSELSKPCFNPLKTKDSVHQTSTLNTPKYTKIHRKHHFSALFDQSQWECSKYRHVLIEHCQKTHENTEITSPQNSRLEFPLARIDNNTVLRIRSAPRLWQLRNGQIRQNRCFNHCLRPVLTPPVCKRIRHVQKWPQQNIRNLQKSHEIIRKCLKSHEIYRKVMKSSDLTVYHRVWPCIAVYDRVLPCFATVWLYLAVFGHCLAVFSRIWPLYRYWATVPVTHCTGTGPLYPLPHHRTHYPSTHYPYPVPPTRSHVRRCCRTTATTCSPGFF